jgi:CBS domain containing-hemolysin-like protein
VSALAAAVLLGLLAFAAACAAAEAACFALTEAERRRAPPRLARILADPEGLLAAVSGARLLAAVLLVAGAVALAREAGPGWAALAAAGAAVVLACVGEILPKSLAPRARERLAQSAAPGIALLVALSAPPRRVLHAARDALVRALGESAAPDAGVSADTLAEVLDHSARTGLIDVREADLLAGLVELEGVRVAEILTPRVDLIVLDLLDRDEERRWFALARALARRLTWVPAVRGGADEIAGLVRLRDVLARPDEPLERLVQPATFVPALASVLDLLRTLRAAGCAEAIVVDEYGGTAGVVTLENVFEEIVGDLRVEGEREAPPVTALGGGLFRVAGALSIRDWNERFGRDVVPAGFETVGGLVAALLGRIPREGDAVALRGIELTVRRVRGRRVESVDLCVEGRARTSEEVPA